MVTGRGVVKGLGEVTNDVEKMFEALVEESTGGRYGTPGLRLPFGLKIPEFSLPAEKESVSTMLD